MVPRFPADKRHGGPAPARRKPPQSSGNEGSMILFAAPGFESMATGLCASVARLKCGRYRAGRFDNGELFIRLETSPTREECVFVGSLTPPDTQLLTTL